jgi:hypothetical protein
MASGGSDALPGIARDTVAIAPAIDRRSAPVADATVERFRGEVRLAARDEVERLAVVRRLAVRAGARRALAVPPLRVDVLAAVRFRPPVFLVFRVFWAAVFAAARGDVRRVTVRFAVVRFVFACFLDARLATATLHSSSIH